MRSIGPGSPGATHRDGAPVLVDAVATRAAVDELDRVSAHIEDAERRRVILTGQVLRTGWWQLEGARSPAAWLRSRLRLGDDTARRLVRLAEVCDRLPVVAVAYTDGSTTAAHLDVLSRAVAGRWDQARSDEGRLVDAACSQGLTAWSDTCADWAARRAPADAVERYAARSLRTRTDLFGDLHGAFSLPGEDAQRVLAALDANTDPDTALCDHHPAARSYHARRADALVDLVCGDGDDLRVTTTVVVVDRPLLAHGDSTTDRTHPTGTTDRASRADLSERTGAAGTADVSDPRADPTTAGPSAAFGPRRRCDHQSVAISPATAARLSCDATVAHLVVDSAGLPLHLGRSRRTFSRAQRRALAARHRRCAFDDCDVAYARCELHHLRHWDDAGRTDIDNAVPLCRWHHHLVHEARWTITEDPDGTRDWHPPPDSPWDPPDHRIGAAPATTTIRTSTTTPAPRPHTAVRLE